jgi:phage-related protein
LDKVQRGEQPDDFKPMPGVGKGVEEIRVHGRERCVPGDLYRPAG